MCVGRICLLEANNRWRKQSLVHVCWAHLFVGSKQQMAQTKPGACVLGAFVCWKQTTDGANKAWCMCVGRICLLEANNRWRKQSVVHVCWAHLFVGSKQQMAQTKRGACVLGAFVCWKQ